MQEQQKKEAWIAKFIHELQSIAQAGLTYSVSGYDLERYTRLLELAAELTSRNSQKIYSEIQEIFSREVGYNTPKVDVRAAVFKDDKILMVREREDNLWSLPGGWADVTLSPAENVLKEIQEETGFICKTIKLIAVYDKNLHDDSHTWPHIYKLLFLCEICGGSPTPSYETLEVDFFSRGNIPPLSLKRTVPRYIEHSFKHYLQPALPTEFD